MAFSHSHKTVFILDRGPYFLDSSRQPVDFDMFMKVKTPGLIPLAPITKSLWTCNVEAVMEYIRIVYDIFPSNKLIQLIVTDANEYSLNSWSESDQNAQVIMNGLAELQPVGKNVTANDCNLLRALNKAVEAVTQPSRIQHQTRTSLTAPVVVNRGRIVVLSAFNGEGAVNRLEERMVEIMTQQNHIASSSDTLLPVGHCELVLVDIVPIGRANNVAIRHKRQLSPCLSSEVHVSQSGRYIAVQLLELAVLHFDLSSTTVTGIPMKEEQNQSSSANYDVELLHSSSAHLELIKSGQHEGLMMPSKEGLYTQTVMLKWCTPKTTTVELQQCTGAFRITPVDVISRPSSCLTNFLLAGRSVMLEQPRKTSNKLISHMLTSHAGEIYLHVLATSRSTLEDPPSISEGAGGRLTDYRISDFGEFMKENRLAPVPRDASSSAVLPLSRVKAQLERHTRLWPLVISDTIIFNMLSVLDPLPSLIMKLELTDSEVQDCRKAIFHVVGIESRNEPLPNSAAGVRGKAAKREEQYRMMWNELEKFVRAHSATSSQHAKVLDCILDCRRPAAGDDARNTSRLVGDDLRSTIDVKSSVDIKREIVDHTTSDQSSSKQDKAETQIKREPDSTAYGSGPSVKRIKNGFETVNAAGQPQSLLSIWTNRLNTQHKKHCLEFSGRQNCIGNKAELYPQLKEPLKVEGEVDVKTMLNKKKS